MNRLRVAIAKTRNKRLNNPSLVEVVNHHCPQNAKTFPGMVEGMEKANFIPYRLFKRNTATAGSEELSGVIDFCNEQVINHEL